MELKGKRFLVAGLGESGLAMARWLVSQGASVRVADSRENPPRYSLLSRLLPEVPVTLGTFRAEDFSQADFIALSPGIPQNTPEIAALAGRVPVISEVDLFAWALQTLAPEAKILAITGSNGKTTTTALTAHLLNEAGILAVACGNISPSLLDALMEALEKGVLPKAWVLELSSFQLETTHGLKADAATILNISQDHLDRYGCMADYVAAKERIFQGNPLQVFNRDDPVLKRDGAGVSFGLKALPDSGNHYGIREGAIWQGQKRLIALEDIPLKGLHNAANVMAAMALCNAIGVEARALLPGLSSFRGLPHRVEVIAEINGVLYVDDSKGTNVGATLAAIEGMGRPVALVLGGQGKGQDFSPLKRALENHGRAVALIGQDAQIIHEAISGCGLPVSALPDMGAAVCWLSEKAQPGDCVMLSPACASFDMYRDYAHRAQVFAAAVLALKDGLKESGGES